MDVLPVGLDLEALAGAGMQQFLLGATRTFVAFTLVVARLSGMMLVAPVFSHPDVPVQLRVFVVLALSLVVTPGLVSLDGVQTFERLDQDGDGRLLVTEVSSQIAPHVEELLTRAGKSHTEGLAPHEFTLPLPLPHTPLDYAWLGAIEFAVGLALGLGILTILSGLQMAGNQIDQQIGVSLGEIFNPEFEVNATLSGQLLHHLGMAVFLIVGGHVLLVSALTETFRTLPVGYAWVSAPALDLIRDLVQQSLLLALQVSAPVLAAMAIVGLAMGILGHTIPQVNVLVIGFPVRTLVGLLILALSFTGVAHVMAGTLPETIRIMRDGLMGR